MRYVRSFLLALTTLAFFLLVLFAALTSAISLFETVVSILQDKLHWNRRLTCLVVFIGVLLVGVPSSLGFTSSSRPNASPPVWPTRSRIISG